MSVRFPVETVAASASTLVDYSGTTTAASSVQIMPADDTARLYRIQNLSKTYDLWFNDTGSNAAPDTPGSYLLVAGAYYEWSSPFAISVYADTAIPFSAGRY